MPHVMIELPSGEQQEYCVLLEKQADFKTLEDLLRSYQSKGILRDWKVEGVTPTNLPEFSDMLKAFERA